MIERVRKPNPLALTDEATQRQMAEKAASVVRDLISKPDGSGLSGTINRLVAAADPVGGNQFMVSLYHGVLGSGVSLSKQQSGRLMELLSPVLEQEKPNEFMLGHTIEFISRFRASEYARPALDAFSRSSLPETIRKSKESKFPESMRSIARNVRGLEVMDAKRH